MLDYHKSCFTLFSIVQGGLGSHQNAWQTTDDYGLIWYWELECVRVASIGDNLDGNRKVKN